MQNHLLQILCRVAMELPAGPSPHDRTLEVLRSVRPFGPDEVASRNRRARYTAGRLGLEGGGGGRTVPAYADEPGVDPSRGTETLAEFVLELDSERWAGTRFVLRAGKALAERRKGVLVRFRPLAERPFEIEPAPPANQLWVGIDGPNDLTLHLTGTAAGRPPRSVPLALSAPPPDSELPPYAHVVLDILGGHDTRSVRGDEAEEAWWVVAPVLRAWERGLVPLEEYPAGSAGPPGVGPRSG